MGKLTLPKLVAEFNKNSSEVVKIQLTEYENTQLLDIRVWVQNEKGDFIPTRKGIALKIDQIDDLLKGIEKAAKKIEKNLIRQ